MKRNLKFINRYHLVILLLGALVFGFIVYLSIFYKGISYPIYTPNDLLEEQNLLLYKDEKNGFSFRYPNKYRLILDIKDFIGFQLADNTLSSSIWHFTINRDKLNSDSCRDFATENTNFVNETAKWLEFKDGTSSDKLNPKIWSRTVIDKKVFSFTNPQGINGYEFHLKVQEIGVPITDSQKQSTEKEELWWGPFYILDLSKQTNQKICTISSPAYSGDPTANSIQIAKAFIDTLRGN